MFKKVNPGADRAPNRSYERHASPSVSFIENCLETIDDEGYFLSDRLPEELVIHTDIAVDHFVPQSRDAAPRNFRIRCPNRIRQKFCCLAHHGEFVEHRGACLLICNKFFPANSRGEIPDIFCGLKGYHAKEDCAPSCVHDIPVNAVADLRPERSGRGKIHVPPDLFFKKI